MCLGQVLEIGDQQAAKDARIVPMAAITVGMHCIMHFPRLPRSVHELKLINYINNYLPL